MASLFGLYFAIVKASYDFKVTRAQKTRGSQVFFLNVQNEIFEIFKMFKNKTKFTRTACLIAEAATIVFCYKMCSQKTLKFQRKTSVLEYVFTKTAGPQAFNFIKKKLQQRCFPGKFDKFLRIPILKNICELTAFRIN